MNALHRELAKLTARAEERAPAGKWRLGFHLEPPVGWLNDPNGLCKFHDAYHVFYQYSPFDPAGGLKLWGHYESKDLLHWQRRPAALYPDEPFDCHGAYSGSALAEEDGLYLYYTGNVKLPGDYDYVAAGREHNTVLAYSPDGKTFQSKRLLMRNSDYPPGLTCHVRDPKVWKEDGRYYMAQGARTLEDEGVALVFVSDDKIHWTHQNTLRGQSPFGYMWECPDLYRLDGARFLSVSPQGLPREETRCQNVYQSGYFPLSGDFTGLYTLGQFREYDYGFDFYAPQTFTDGARRILIGWMGMPDAEDEYQNPTAALGWQHALTVPRELRAQNGRIFQTPIRELEALRDRAAEQTLRGSGELAGLSAFDLETRCQGPVKLTIRGCARLTWADGLLTLQFPQGGYGREIRRAHVETLENLRILGDASSLEIFANDGETVMTSRYYPEGQTGIRIECGAGETRAWGMLPMKITG